MRGSAAIRVATCLLFLLASSQLAQEPKRSDRFSGPRRDPPARDFDFLHLKLEADFDWEQRSVRATVTHQARAFRDGTRFLELDQVKLDVESAALENGQALRFDVLPEKLRIDLGRETKRGEEIRLAIRYRAQPRRGLYFRQRSESYPEVSRHLWTQGEAQEARHWIPCFDHPSDKLTTELVVTVPRGMTAVSNGKLVSSAPRGDSEQTFHWLQEKPHTTYLIALVAGDFAVWEGDADGIPLRGFVEKRFAAHAARSFELTPKMMRFFQEKTGFPYPWGKYDQACVAEFVAGGMENTSLTILTDATLRDERAALDGSSLGLVAHELAHQWFGDVVTCKDWGDLWLNESFATFFENLFLEHHLGPDEGVHERHEQGEGYKGEDRGRYRRPLSTRSWRDPESMFDAHTYPKGARILSMLRHVLGDALFFAGIRHYLHKHAFQPVEAADFRVAMEEATGSSLGWFFDQWIFAGGHPRYRVETTWQPDEGSVRVEVAQTQKVDDLTPLFRMPVVIAVVTPAGRAEHRVWVSEARQTFTFAAAERPRMVRFDPGDWILKELEQPRSREELLYQLEHDPDVMGRHEAAGQLAKLAPDATVVAALLERLEKEPFWGVRREIVQALEPWKTDPVRRALLTRLAAEPKSAVRREIAGRLGELKGEGVAAALRRAIAEDRSYDVAAMSLRALGQVAGREAQADALAALGRDSHEDEIRRAALEVLASVPGLSAGEREALVERLVGLVAARESSADTRAAAVRALGRVGKGSEKALETLRGALGDERGAVRRGAIEGLGELGDRRAVPALVERREKEPARFGRRDLRELIERTISRLEGQTDLQELSGEVRRLREQNARLEERLSEIERRGKSGRL